MAIDLEELAAVIRLLKDADFSEFNYSRGDTVLQVRRGEPAGTPPFAALAASAAAPAVPSAAPAPAARGSSKPAVAPPDDADKGSRVRAPLLGTFYSAPKPGEPSFVKPGDRVEADTVVCIIEVMKLMNSVTAGVAGIVAAVHVRDGALVEFDQPLFTIAEAS
ncbi:acetyl-CoA carboxylase biotin carboxyl carrier protein [Shinella sp. NM-101]|uniref:acetyl-CoA carboxylase biotin carboxyl carrier protein n=1 Tax=Shinella sp. NM-101 TaxID=2744455 RepID=UPI001F27EBC1